MPTTASATDRLTDAVRTLEEWADEVRDRAIRSSIQVLATRPEVSEGAEAVDRWVLAESCASYLYGYVMALTDAAERLRTMS